MRLQKYKKLYEEERKLKQEEAENNKMVAATQASLLKFYQDQLAKNSSRPIIEENKGADSQQEELKETYLEWLRSEQGQQRSKELQEAQEEAAKERSLREKERSLREKERERN